MFPDFVEFQQNFNGGKTQLVYAWVPADLETPVQAYLKLTGNAPNSFLLESVEGGNVLGRYSIIGFDPDYIWKKKDDSMDSLRRAVRDTLIDIVPNDLPPMAVSGLFGYLSYDTVRMVEKIPDTKPDSLNVPDSILIRPRVLAIFDNVRNMICLVAPVYSHASTTKESAEQAYQDAQHRIQACIKKFSSGTPNDLLNKKSKLDASLKVFSNTEKSGYIAAVQKAKEYIKAGDIFQVVLSQRFETDFDLPAFDLYRSLRRLNPSPFLFYLNMGDFSLVGSSPEILVRVRDNKVTIRPIAGTRPRGATAQEDETLASDLLADPKERAEHLMLLDLGRNDVGRIADFGSVKVTAAFTVEKYSHVMHIVSNVEGTLKKGCDIVDAFFAGFPAGTVSGAPKIRAMEIIDELEVNRRSYYGGGVGYFSGNGTLDTCIALRTALVKDGKLYVQAGAGIVADSIPESEHQECVNKAQALLKAAEQAVALAQSSPD